MRCVLFAMHSTLLYRDSISNDGKIKCQFPIVNGVVNWQHSGRQGTHRVAEWSIEIVEVTEIQAFENCHFKCAELTIQCSGIDKLLISTNTYYEGQLEHTRPTRFKLKLLFEGRV